MWGQAVEPAIFGFFEEATGRAARGRRSVMAGAPHPTYYKRSVSRGQFTSNNKNQLAQNVQLGAEQKVIAGEEAFDGGVQVCAFKSPLFNEFPCGASVKHLERSYESF